MDPEYASSGILNEKSDIYSFGIVLLKLIMGRDPIDHDSSTQVVRTGTFFESCLGTIFCSVQSSAIRVDPVWLLRVGALG